MKLVNMIYRILKNTLIISICLCTSVTSFAAVSVSDDSTFITKAEFAADLSNISNRISQVENSIDARIDSLVSQYLTRNGIWNGANQIVLNNLGTTPTTIDTLKVLENINKTGLLLLPYYIDIDYKVGICNGNFDSKSSDSIDRAMGSPVYYMININVGMYNDANDVPYQTKNYYFGLSSEYDTGNTEEYRLVLNEQPSGVFVFFVAKGDSVKLKFNSTLEACMDWWSFSMASPITGNANTLSGKAIASGNGTSTTNYGNWINNSYYNFAFGVKGTTVAVY